MVGVGIKASDSSKGEDGGVEFVDVCEDVVEGFDEEALDCCCFFKSLACFLLCFAELSISKSTGKGVPMRKDLGINTSTTVSLATTPICLIVKPTNNGIK